MGRQRQLLKRRSRGDGTRGPRTSSATGFVHCTLSSFVHFIEPTACCTFLCSGGLAAMAKKDVTLQLFRHDQQIPVAADAAILARTGSSARPSCHMRWAVMLSVLATLAILIHMRLASRVLRRTTHVTAIIRDDSTTPISFRHYDNDSIERVRGTFRQLTTRELWTNCDLTAIIQQDSALNRAVQRLEPLVQHVVLPNSPPSAPLPARGARRPR